MDKYQKNKYSSKVQKNLLQSMNEEFVLCSLPPLGTRRENPFKAKCFDLFKPSVISLHR